MKNRGHYVPTFHLFLFRRTKSLIITKSNAMSQTLCHRLWRTNLFLPIKPISCNKNFIEIWCTKTWIFELKSYGKSWVWIPNSEIFLWLITYIFNRQDRRFWVYKFSKYLLWDQSFSVPISNRAFNPIIHFFNFLFNQKFFRISIEV